MTPQPISAARSSGISFRILTIAFSCTSICSAKDDRLRNWCSFSGLDHCIRFEAPGSNFTVVSVQSTVRPVVQLSQVPQNTDRQVTTWSPGLT
ncbi:hypothetical protein AB7M75_007620 [Bradyrhizobium ottawaense]